MLKHFPIITITFLFFFHCGQTPFTTDVIMFDSKTYPSTNPNKIEIYNSRLEIPYKYFEIGTIKYTGEPNYQKIKEIGSSKGADALINDGNNFILIKNKKSLEEENNEKII